MKKFIVAFLRDEAGLTMVEYAIAGALVAAGAVAAFTDAGHGSCVTRITGALQRRRQRPKSGVGELGGRRCRRAAAPQRATRLRRPYRASGACGNSFVSVES